MQEILNQQFKELSGSGYTLTDESKRYKFMLSFAEAFNSMLEEGTLKLLSTADVANTYGHSRQYWDKLLTQKVIPYYSYGKRRFTLNIYIETYLRSIYGEDYLCRVERIVKRMKRQLINDIRTEDLSCPRCTRLIHSRFLKISHVKATCRFCRFTLIIKR